MSKVKKLKIRCSKCKEVFDFDSYESICVKDDSELKRKTLTKEVFKGNCPKCGQLHHVNFPTLYYDEEHQYLIRLVNKGSDVNDYVDTGLTHESAFENNKCRLVSEMHELVEKILIFETGLNDKAIEVVKVIVLSGGEFNRGEVRGCYFAGKFDDNLRFDVVLADKSVRSATVNIDGYERCLNENKALFEEEAKDWQFVNINYGLDFMAQKLKLKDNK